MSRSEGPTAPFCENGAVHNPNERSNSRSLIQVKIHSRRALLKQQSRQRPPTLDGFAFVPPRAAFLGGIHWVAELASEVMRQLHLRPTFRSKKRDAQSDHGRIAPARAHSSCHLLITRLTGCRDLVIGHHAWRSINQSGEDYGQA